MKKIYFQLRYIGDKCYWSLIDGKKRFNNVSITTEYQNYHDEKLAIECGYKPYHGSLEEVSRVNDLNTKERVVTYTLMVE